MRKLQAFIDFVTCHNDILSRQKKLTQLEQSLFVLNQHVQQHRDAIAQKHKDIFTLRKAIDGQELELKVLDAQEADKKKRLENANTVKEFQSLTSELEIINAKKNSTESALFDALSTVETLKEQTAFFETTTQEAIDSLLEQQKSLEQTKSTDSQVLRELEQACTTKKSQVNKELLEKFEAMRDQVDNPAVPIVNESCSACFYSLPQTELGPAKKGELAQCRDCYRMLYFEN